VDEITYWSKQEIFTKDGVHYRLKGHVTEMSTDYDRYYNDLRFYDRVMPSMWKYSITFRITEGPMAKVRGKDGEYGTFMEDSWQDAIDAGFFELVAPLKR
jgi:hypothetical protein